MNRLFTTILIACVLTVVVATSAACSGSYSQAQGLADRAVHLLSRGENRAFAEMMHYPPTYTPEERKKDISSTVDVLDLFAREFGATSGLKEHKGIAAFYELGGTGGNLPYISSLSPHYSTPILYATKFSKRGDGYIQVTVIQLKADSPFEILGVYFGLPAANPRSKPAILEIARKELALMKIPVTPEMERQLKASLNPVRYPK
jgi:hypothetical protein